MYFIVDRSIDRSIVLANRLDERLRLRPKGLLILTEIFQYEVLLLYYSSINGSDNTRPPRCDRQTANECIPLYHMYYTSRGILRYLLLCVPIVVEGCLYLACTRKPDWFDPTRRVVRHANSPEGK